MDLLNKDQNRNNNLTTTITQWLRQADLVADIGRIVAVVLLALGLGLIYNAVFIWPVQQNAPVADQSSTINKITMRRAYQLAQQHEAIIVDTQEPEVYAQEHIAGAMNLPFGEFEAYYPDFATQVKTTETLILYCEPGCMSKDVVADELIARGYQNISLMDEGIEEWRGAGYSIASNGGRE